VKINVAQLKVATENAITRAGEAQVEYDEALALAEKQYFEDFKTGLQQWRPFYEALGKALRKSATEKDIKALQTSLMPQGEDRYGDPKPARLWRPFRAGKTERRGNANIHTNADHKLGPRPVYEVRNLENLRDFLGMIEDEVVTSAALENAGFRNLSKLMDTVRNQHWVAD